MRMIVSCCVLAIAVIAAGRAQAVVLYDGALGTVPQSQGWLYLTDPLVGSSATLTAAGGTAVLDTTAARGESAGLFSHLQPGVPTLTRTPGFELLIYLQVKNEGHDHANRGGFSVIIVTSDLQALETAFWEDEIWVYEDDDGGASPGDLFTHAEGVGFDTVDNMVRYGWLIQGNTYTLTADGSPILTGPLRDYTNFSGVIDPYEIPDFIFFGDDTSSADARVSIGRVELNLLSDSAAVPEPATAAMLCAACVTVMRRRPRRLL